MGKPCEVGLARSRWRGVSGSLSLVPEMLVANCVWAAASPPLTRPRTSGPLCAHRRQTAARSCFRRRHLERARRPDGMERLCPVMALGVTVVDAAEKREAGWIYLDVRTEEEFVQEHVPGSVHVPVFVSDPQGGLVPNANFTAEVARLIPDAESPLLVGCRSGRRSQTAIELLSASEDAPRYEMLNVDGGILAWQEASLPVE